MSVQPEKNKPLRDIEVMLPNGEVSYLTEGTKITNVKVIAGKGRDRQIDIIDTLVEKFGGAEDEWQKKKGFGFIDYNDESVMVELHWYEEPSVGKVLCKIKIDSGGNWFHES